MSVEKKTFALGRSWMPSRQRRLPRFMEQANRFVFAAGLAVLALVVWQLVAYFGSIPEWKLPSPWQVLQTLGSDAGLIARHARVTAYEAVLGFAIAVIVGLVLAVAIHQSRIVERALFPYVIASQAIPIIAIAPILIIWLGFGILPKVIVIVLITFFPITVNTVDGLRKADPDMLTLMRTMGASRWQIFKMVEVPSALPLFFSGAKIAAAVSVIGAFIGEYVGASEGLSWLIRRSSAQFLTARVYASVFALSVMGIALFYAVSYIERLATPWARRPEAPAPTEESRS